MKKLILLLLGLSLIWCFSLYAKEVTKVGTTAAPFLNIDVGGRAVGMGGAFVAVANDVSAMYWNPAGVARISKTEAMFCNTRWIADVNFNYAAFATNLGNLGTVGVNATFLTMDQMERTTIREPDGTGEMFDAGSYAFGLCYARNLTDRFSIGFNFKYITENIYHSSAHGIAMDIGTLFDTQFQGLKIGMSITNYGTKMQLSGRDLLLQADVDPTVSGNNPNINANLQTDRYDLPLMFRVGLSMDVLKGAANSNLILSVDALHPNDDVEYMNVGGEYVFNNLFALRAGYKSLFARYSEEGLTCGAGLNYKLRGAFTLRIDYGYEDFGVLKNVQMFTVGLSF
ncbi:MAG: PorV/PorQ family protein [candidate division KSB1 bacterium]|nr:PorV/PorQ family protein [candidate division KSB1 bacterium]